MEELREEVGVKETLRMKLVRRRLKWTGYVETMDEVRLMKSADAFSVKGRKKRGRNKTEMGEEK